MNNIKNSSDLLEYVYDPVRNRLQIAVEMLSELGSQQSGTLAELLEHVLDSSGKLIRPTVVLLASNFHPNDGCDVETLAVAIELLHMATLIHDDTVDSADVRRGKATVSSVWGPKRAVLLGDYVFASAAKFVCNTENVGVIRRFSETAMELSSGEFREIESAYRQDLTRDQYLDRIYRKTASLFTTAAESGAIVVGSPEHVANALRDYGYNLGMAFQIVDDVLDLDAKPEEVGKPVGNDLTQGILTMPAILALEQYPVNNPISALCRDPSDQKSLDLSLEMIRNSSFTEDSIEIAREYSSKALDSIKNIEMNRSHKSLEALAEYVVHRRL
jgi:heptaprenyl diphosphate synthase